MELVQGTDDQLITVLKESVELWGHSFTLTGYIAFNFSFRKHPWPNSNFEHLVFLDEKQRVLSSCKLYTLQGKSNGRPVKIAQIGAVFTPRIRRNQGNASAMLQILLSRLKSQDYDLALLFSDIPPYFYKRLGFKVIRQHDLIFDIRPPADTSGKVIEVLDNIQQPMVDLYTEQCRNNFCIGRDELYWDLLLYRKKLYDKHRIDKSVQEYCFCASNGDAYIWVLWNKRRMQIKDVAYRNPDSLLQIFSYLSRNLGPNAIRHVYGWLPSNFDTLDCLRYKRRLERDIALLMIQDLTGRNQDLFYATPEQIHVWSLDYF